MILISTFYRGNDLSLFKKKMRLNGNPFKIYVIDSVSSIEERIAFKFNSLPDWLVYKSKRPKTVKEFREINDLQIDDYLHSRVLNQATLVIPGDVPPSVTVEQVENLFIATNTTLLKTEDRDRSLLLYSIKNLHRNAEAIWRDRTGTLGSLNKEIKENKTKVIKLEKTAIAFEKISPISYTLYEINNIQFTINLGQFESNLSFLFDSLITSRFVPYAALAQQNQTTLYKLHAGFEIDPAWTELELTDVLFLKVNSSNTIESNSHLDSYMNVAFAINDNFLLATMDIKIGEKFVDKESFIKRVLDSFTTLNLFIYSQHDNAITAHYSIPNQCLDAYVFAELTLNDELFNSVVAINEFLRPSKLSSTVYVHRLRDTLSTVYMRVKQTRRQNEYGMSEVGEWYVRCRLRSETIDDIISFQIIIGKLMTIYNTRYEAIVDTYQQFIPSFTPQDCTLKNPPKRSYIAKGLRAIAPEVFFPTYTRKCANPPEIITNDDDYGEDVMEFPIKGEIMYGKPVKTRKYVCKEKSHPFIGLRKNELGNSSVFPAVPCCFKQDQKNKPKSLYRSYYFGDGKPQVARQTQQTETFKHRILYPGETEVLPDDLEKLFYSIESNPNVKYIRNGITKSRFSSIEAILFGKGSINYTGRMRKSTIFNKVIHVAKKLDSDAYAMAAKQELYDSDVNEIRDMIRTEDLRPSKFVHALELVLDCNIFIFNDGGSGGGDFKGRLIVPNHANFYLRYRPDRETFFLYEHYGNENDNVDYPAVELITRTPLEDNDKFFPPGDDVVKRIFQIFTKLTRTYSLEAGTIRPILKFPIPSTSIVSQLIDVNGKCRLINIKDETEKISIATDPLPPFAVPLAEKIYRLTNLNSVKNFIDRYRINVPNWQRRGEIGLTIGNVNCVLLVGKSIKYPNVTIDEGQNLYDDLDVPNVITDLSLTKQQSNVLLQYVLKATAALMPINDLNIDDKLMQIKFYINPTVKYKLQSDRYDSNPSFITSDAAIVIPSEETRKRLLFLARLYAIYTPDKLLPLRTKEIMDGFYSNPHDFTDIPMTLILNGNSALMNVINIHFNNIEKKLYSFVQPTTTKLYFFKNKLISNDIFLAVPLDSLTKANDIVIAWTINGYYNSTPPQSDRRPAVYTISNEKEIELISASDGAMAYKGCILGYKRPIAPLKRGKKKKINNKEEETNTAELFAYVALLSVSS